MPNIFNDATLDTRSFPCIPTALCAPDVVQLWFRPPRVWHVVTSPELHGWVWWWRQLARMDCIGHSGTARKAPSFPVLLINVNQWKTLWLRHYVANAA